MRILIVGLGSIAKKHIDAILELREDADFFAFRSFSSAQEVEGITNLFSWENVEKYAFDFAIVSNPTGEHLKTMQQLLHFGIPLFVEKPLFSQIGNEEEEIVKKIGESNLITYVACNLRFLDCLNFIKQKIKDEIVNEVNIYCGSYLPDWRPGVDFRTVYSANKEMGGGVHIDLIHELDYLYWIFGKPQKSNAFFSSESSLDISAYDYANYRWTYDSFTANVVLNYYRRDAKRSLEIVCAGGTYSVNLLANSVVFNNEIIYESEQKTVETYKEQMKFFMNNIMSGKDAEFNDVNQSYEILKLCIED